MLQLVHAQPVPRSQRDTIYKQGDYNVIQVSIAKYFIKRAWNPPRIRQWKRTNCNAGRLLYLI